MSEIEYVGKIKGMKTLKQMIESKEVVPASQLVSSRLKKRLKKGPLRRLPRRSNLIAKPSSPPARWRGVIIGLVKDLLNKSSVNLI